MSDQAIYYALQREGASAFTPQQTRRRKVSDEQIIEAYKRLGSGNAVAKELRTNAVYDVLRSHGIQADGLDKYRNSIRKIDSLDKERIAEAYRAGKSSLEVARAFGVSVELIFKSLRSLGVPIRSTKPHMTVTEKVEAKRLYESGMTFKNVAKSLAREEKTIIRLINDEYPEIVRSKAIGPGGPHWRGGRRIHRGYVMLWVSPDDEFYSTAQASGYAYEHRLVMARKLGRPLLDTETVHHIDGNTENNSPENLELRQGKHGKHVVMCCLDCGSRNIGHAPLASAAAPGD